MILRHIIQSFLKSTEVSAERRHLILKDTIHLLNKRDRFSIPPRVRVKSSSIQNAGQGVFATTDLEKFSPLCLYPGVYTPPLPFPYIGGEDSTDEYVYLANESIQDDNEYVLNLNDIGGYIDANNHEYRGADDLEYNHGAVGHLVNHGKGEQANVDVLSFHWNQLLNKDVMDQIKSDSLHNIPNTMRNDGTAWFLDSRTGEINYFHESNGTKVKMESICYNNTIPIAGAVLYASKKIKEGQELFLNYKLKPPYPSWARDWIE